MNSAARRPTPSGRMNIILDLDGTLIDTQFPVGAQAAFVLGAPGPKHVCKGKLEGLHIYKRPGLDEFLQFCFTNFQHVGLWTHSGEEWVNEVLSHVLTIPDRSDWSFIYTGKRATRVQQRPALEDSNGNRYIKDLKKVFRRKDLRAMGFEKYNTIIVEDTPENCIRNFGNAIYISTFDVVKKSWDSELHLLKLYLEQKVLKCDNVRHVEKRTWKKEATELEAKRKLQQCQHKASTCFWMQEKWKNYLNLNVNVSNGMQHIESCPTPSV